MHWPSEAGPGRLVPAYQRYGMASLECPSTRLACGPRAAAPAGQGAARSVPAVRAHGLARHPRWYAGRTDPPQSAVHGIPFGAQPFVPSLCVKVDQPEVPASSLFGATPA